MAPMRPSVVRKGRSRKGSPLGRLASGSEGGERVADAEEKASVSEAPEILAVVVESPLGAAEDVAGGELEEDGLNVAVLVFRGFVGQTLEEATDAVGEEEMLVVDVVERVHGAAGEKELGGERREADWFQRDANARGRDCGQPEGGSRPEEKAQGYGSDYVACTERG